jgi:hypothetical protein
VGVLVITIKANDSTWTAKGTTVSQQFAQKEFDLTFEEIVAGIHAGKLQYRENYIYGSPFLRLIRWSARNMGRII